MADSAPVNEVLCEAIQYLLKLGTNLRQRSEVLRDKRIRKDKLRNTHAVQKATSKVLVLCELAKKSIVNVESSVKAIQDRIDNMQANNTGEKTSSSQKVSFYEYFTFKSKRLKCRNKINIKLYTSAKVSVSKMLASIQDKYPVFYDCKLFRQRIKSEKIADKNSNADEKHLDKKRRIEEFDSRRHSDSMQSDEQIDHQSSSNVNVKDTHKASKVDHSSKEGKCMSENGETEQLDTIACRDNCLQDTCNDSDEVKNKKTCETSVEKKERKSRSTMKNISDKTKKYLDSISKCHNNKQNNVLEEICSDNESTHRNVDDSNKACNSEMEDNCKNKMLNKNKKTNNKEKEDCNSDGNSKRSNTEDRLFIANNKSAMSKDKNENEQSTNENIEKCNDSIELSGTKNNLTEEEAFTENQHSKSYESDRSMDSDVSKKSYIKCVNINKLLRPDKIISSSTVLSNEVNKTKRGSKKIREKCSKKYNTKSRSNENYEAQNAKLDAIKIFKPKSFSINIVRLPKLNDKFLRSQNLTRINQFVPHNIEIIQSKEQDDRSLKTYKNKFKILQDNENQEKDIDSRKNETLKKNENQEKDIDSIKDALLNVSDSEYTDEDIRQVNENVKKSLLFESDSDESTKMQEKENDNSNDATKSPNSSNPTSTQSKSVDEINITNNDKELVKNKTSEINNEHYETNSQRVLKTPDKQTEEKLENSDIEKTSSPPNNRVLRTPDDKRNQGNEGTTPPSTRKRIMESMHAKKMLLTYSSSDTEDEQLKNAFKEIKDALLKGNSSSDEERQQSKQCHRKLSSESDVSLINERITKDAKHLKSRYKRKREKSRSSNSGRSQQEESTESSSNKMDRSKDKSDSSRQHSHNEDSDKDIKGLINLRTLKKSHRRRRSTSSDRSRNLRSKMAKMPKAPVINEELLLQAESSSDAASVASNDGEVEELPRVPVAALNGDGIDHLAKDDLLGDSDSSSSQNHTQNSQDEKPGETDDETVPSKRRKANAISSDSEAGSSRRKDRRISDFEDSEDDGCESVKKSKRKKKHSDSDASAGSDEEGKKKRRRIKNVDDTDSSGSETENEGRNKHGRKNIRKVMGKNQLEEATKKAARQEKERMARIAERQKLYNNLQFDESGKPDEVVLDKVVLDFDPETKEPLIEVDKGLVKKLKPHQANGIKFMWDACFESAKRIKKDKGSGCILAHCMGLGKTLQVVSLTHTLLTHSDLTRVNRVLVVCPLSTVLNWVNEFKMWLKHAETEYEVDVYELSRFKQNSDRAFQLQQWFQHGGVCVLGYEMFRNLSSDNNKKFKKKMLKNFQESLVDPGPDLVVCDEGHLLKNEKTSLSQAMNKVKTLRRIVLTGTPLQNNLKEYYCMVQFVKPNLLGKYNEYLNRFVNPITNGQYTDSTEHDIRIMKRRSHVLHKMLDGAVQRRDYGVLAPFLPPKHEYVLFITLAEVQTKLYQHYLDNYSRRPLAGKSSGFLFPDFQSLQRIWTHPLVLKYNSERYEIMQQKKREREEEDSEGSLKDFIDDESTPEESSTAESTDESSYMSDDSRKKKKKKSPKKSKSRSTRRGTRANPVEIEDDDIQEVVEVKTDNPTEWWMQLVSEEELDDIRNSPKLVLLFDILRQCEAIGDKLLVFSQSLYSLDLIEHFLGKVDEATQEGRVDEKLGGHVGSWSPGIDYFRLDGSTSCENRSIWCKNFNREDNPRARLFLISTRAGGLGINLVAANRVVIFDVSWNPSHDVQSIFRVYRFGQKKPCYIYRFLAMGTMEEKIYERQVTKQAISKRVIDEQQIDRHYAENDLAELYKFEATPPQPRPIPPLPKDRLFAEMLKEHEQWIYKYHEHDSLLENKEEETLTEEERKAAWEDFENEKTKPPVPFQSPYVMPNGMMSNYLAAQQQTLAYTLAMMRKDSSSISENQLRELMPLLTNPQFMQKMSEMYKYQPGMLNPALMNSVMNPAAGAGGGGGGMGMGGTSGLQYEPPWQRQQQMRLQQLMQQQQNPMAAKYYAGGLGSRDPVAMAMQHQAARDMMLGERSGRPRGRPPHPARPKPTEDVVNLDSD